MINSRPLENVDKLAANAWKYASVHMEVFLLRIWKFQELFIIYSIGWPWEEGMADISHN